MKNKNFKLLNKLNKSRVTTALLLLFSLALFLFDCNCESEPEVTSSSSTSTSKSIGKYCNEDGVCFETNTIIGLVIIMQSILILAIIDITRFQVLPITELLISQVI